MFCVQTSARKMAILIEGFRGVSQPFQENVKIVPWFRPQQFPSSDLSHSSCLYCASMTIKTHYYPTDAQIHNS